MNICFWFKKSNFKSHFFPYCKINILPLKTKTCAVPHWFLFLHSKILGHHTVGIDTQFTMMSDPRPIQSISRNVHGSVCDFVPSPSFLASRGFNIKAVFTNSSSSSTNPLLGVCVPSVPWEYQCHSLALLTQWLVVPFPPFPQYKSLLPSLNPSGGSRDMSRMCWTCEL